MSTSPPRFIPRAGAARLTLLCLISTGLLQGCLESEEQKLAFIEKRALAEARARVTAETEARKAQADAAEREAKARAQARTMELEAEERIRRQREEREEARARQAQQEREQSMLAAGRKAVEDIEAGFRRSLMETGTYVLVLRNISNATADFNLKCFNTNGGYRTFPIALPAGQSKEIGFLEGWSGNFLTGEYCKAIFQGQELWKVTKS